MAEILTLEGAAKYLKLAPITLYRKARKGEIPAAKLGKIWRFHRGQLEEWVRNLAGEGTAHVPPPGAFRHLSTRESEAVLQFIQALKKQYGRYLKKVILYGSRARGDLKADSDIDLLLVIQGISEDTRKEISTLAHRFSLEEDVRIQTFVISGDEWKKPTFRTFLLAERIAREGICLHG